MYYNDYFYGNEKHYSSVLKTEVNLDELHKGEVQLRFKPCLEDVIIIRDTMTEDGKVIESNGLEYYKRNLNYDKDNDRIEIFLSKGFDDFIFDVCFILGLGRVNYANIEEFEDTETVNSMFARSVILTLDEFKRLDGFAGQFNIGSLGIEYEGIRISKETLLKFKCDDFERIDGYNEYLLRGEDLMKWD